MIDAVIQSKAKQLIPAVLELRRQARQMELSHEANVRQVDPDYQASARNLLHYLALRQTDIRPLQNELVAIGLTSLGKAEMSVMSTLENVLRNLHVLADEPFQPLESEEPWVSYQLGPQLLEQHTEQLLGDPHEKRKVRIMVTMPSEAATDGALIHDLVAAGMDVMRINCAHDDQAAWQAMIDNLRLAERSLGRTVKVFADLAGPKLRTGSIQPVGQIVKFRPQRNARGQVEAMCRVWFTPEEAPEPAPEEADGHHSGHRALRASRREVGDTIALMDARGRKRRLSVTARIGESCLAETDRTHYVETGMRVRLMRDGRRLAKGQIGALPALVPPIPLQDRGAAAAHPSRHPGPGGRL